MKTVMGMMTGLLLVCAIRAPAAYTISVTTSPTVNTETGQSGQSWFDVSFSGGGTFSYVSRNLWAVDSFNNPLTPGVDSPFSSLVVDPSSTLLLGAGVTYNSGQTYRLMVDWTVASDWNVTDQFGIYFNLFVNQPNAVRANAGATDIVNIEAASVPEPPQTKAGALVLGCGLLMGVGRRLFTKRLV